MTKANPSSLVRVPVAGLLAWLVPGLGHFFIGDTGRGLVFFVTITVTFWTGVAIGGVRSTVDPQHRKLWFVAQLCTAGHTLGAYGLHSVLAAEEKGRTTPPAMAHWGSVDVAVHYTGVAGLLNLLIIFDALGRAELVPATGRRKHARADSVP